MTSPRRPRSLVRRRGLALAVAIATAFTMSSVASPGTSSAKPGAPPKPVTSPATHIAVTSLVSTVATPLGAAGAPAALIQTGEPFTVTAQLRDAAGVPTPVSTTKGTVLTVAVDQGLTALVGGTTSVTIPAGGHTATFTALVLAPAANNVRLGVRATSGTKAALALTPGATDAFDVVVSSSTTVVTDRGRSQFVSKDGVDVPCTPTAEAQTCVDVLLPSGVASDVFFSTGVCDEAVGCTSGRDVLQVLADFGSGYNKTNPATIILKCDKSLCAGGGVPSYLLKVNLDATGALADAPACGSKGVIDEAFSSCVDYAQSKRDGAGDLHLYWLVPRDARGSCC